MSYEWPWVNLYFPWNADLIQQLGDYIAKHNFGKSPSNIPRSIQLFNIARQIDDTNLNVKCFYLDVSNDIQGYFIC